MPIVRKPKKRQKKGRARKRKRVHRYRRRGPGLLELIHDELKRHVPPPGFKRFKFQPYRPPAQPDVQYVEPGIEVYDRLRRQPGQ